MTTEVELHIFGVGSVGSHFAYHVAKRHRRHPCVVHVYDGDAVDQKNLESSSYGAGDVGHRKVDAIARLMREWGDVQVVPHFGRVEDAIPLAGYVFTACDTSEARRKQWKSSIAGNTAVLWMVEARIDTNEALIHTVNPRREDDRKAWEGCWMPSPPETATRSCGAAMTGGPMPDLAANLAYWQFVAAMNAEKGGPDPAFRVEVHASPMMTVRSFSIEDIYS